MNEDQNVDMIAKRATTAAATAGVYFRLFTLS